MDLSTLKRIFTEHGCKQIYVKELAANDNSKNQVYLAGSFDILNILPISESDIISESAGDWKRERFKISLDFSWLGDNGILCKAPNSQLILYPKYPEVRFSGFLQGCAQPPSSLMTKRLPGRLFFLGITEQRKVIGFVTAPESPLASEFSASKPEDTYGVFSVISLADRVVNKECLLNELLRIHSAGWIISKRLDKDRNILPCLSPNCGGYTLEAELGITPNGYAEPDFMGWEVKQFKVSNFDKITSSVITLMTPEPTHGYYKDQGVEAFVRKYGYEDLRGREDRMNFGGIHLFGKTHSRTNLRLELPGFDEATGKIRNADGRIALIDSNDNEAASWSFSSLLKHWSRKHNQACYVPSLTFKDTDCKQLKYHYGNKIILGTGTDFLYFLKQMACGNIYYDPGIKVENCSGPHPTTKRRSQFRIKSRDLGNLYKQNQVVVLE